MTALAIAHRGDPVRERENTLPAFAAAAALGADMVELDLRRTRDGEIVVLHDQTLERLWGLDASVGDLEWPEVAALGAGDVRISTAARRPRMRDAAAHGRLHPPRGGHGRPRRGPRRGSARPFALRHGQRGGAARAPGALGRGAPRAHLDRRDGAAAGAPAANSAPSTGTRCSPSSPPRASAACTRPDARCRPGRWTPSRTWPACWPAVSTPSSATRWRHWSSSFAR